MPKMKTNKSASKRFKTTKSGRIKRHKAFSRHLLAGKTPKRRRNLRKSAMLDPTDAKRVQLMLPHA